MSQLSVRTADGEQSLSIEEFEAQIRRGQISPTTPVRFAVLTGDRWVDARDLEVFRRLYAPARLHFTRTFSLGAFPWLTVSLCLLQIAIYVAVGGFDRSVALDPLLAAGAKMQPNIVELGETWRLLTANFLHRDVLHLFFNMFFLFNVGGTIENVYRVQDYLWLIVVSALSTTLLSTLMSVHPSVGSSGIVFGLFGAASVFGYKYGEILPVRYRRYFGHAVLPYALFILYVGLATESTDNWGHLGGMVGGVAVAVGLKPKLLRLGDPPPRSFLAAYGPAFLTAVALITVFVAGRVIHAFGPALERQLYNQSGIVVSYPSGWRDGTNHLGMTARGNALGTTLGLVVERASEAPFDLLELRRRFLEDTIGAVGRDGDIASVEVRSEKPFAIEGARALELRIDLDSRAGPLSTRNILIERGYYAYTIVLAAPRAWTARYEPVFQKMLARANTRLVEPAALAASRRAITVFPGMSSAYVDLGDELARIGDARGASSAYARALVGIPDQPEARFGLAKLALDYRGDLEDAESIARGLYHARPDEPAVVALLVDLRMGLGQVEGACDVLQGALDHLTEPPQALRERLRDLRCRSTDLRDR
ncbi:MAG: rhomboid family intramembrane serine protease [Deltaproteobacteria bacterium]|nr:rhomboid family intramembrane serine protease [Deltaproteobacteria bacterium]